MQPLIASFVTEKYHNTLRYAVIWGSYVYGTATPTSDIDVIVVVNTSQVSPYIFIDEKMGKLDVTEVSEQRFIRDIHEHKPYAMGILFLPKEFILYGDVNIYISQFKWHGPTIRISFGETSRHTWNRGVKKLTKETTEHEHYIGKKCLYHALREFSLAKQLYVHKRLDFTDPELLQLRAFYLSIRDLPVTEFVENGKLKDKYVDIYKKADQEFRKIVLNEEQYKQSLKKYQH